MNVIELLGNNNHPHRFTNCGKL